MIKELLDVTFPNYRTTTYCKVLQSILREQHNELKEKIRNASYQRNYFFFVFFIKRCKQKGTNFCIFDKKDASKNKIKQNNNKVKDWK
jgi:hypothetical protein